MYHSTLKNFIIGHPLRVGLTALLGIGLLLVGGPAKAQFPSPRDGYAPDGTYRVQVELSPYLWLPATQTNLTIGPNEGSASTGIPSLRDLANSLHGAFLGYGLLRYGPWSAELDINWVSAYGHKAVASQTSGQSVDLSANASIVRIAPGFGYEVFSGDMGKTPVTVDARVGFAVLTWSASVSSENNVLGSASGDGTFVQPWIGTRMAIYPSRRWRVELGGIVQGFGVGEGSWGWGASALASYAVNDWMVITGGFRALSSSRSEETTSASLPATRSIDMVGYGPVLGIGFRF